MCTEAFGLGMNGHPHAHNLHGEIAVSYQGATGNLSTEALQDCSGRFLFLIIYYLKARYHFQLKAC